MTCRRSQVRVLYRPPRVPRPKGLGTFFRGGRYRTRTAAEATAACGGNREPRLGPRSDFSKPCQGAAEKSANATRTGASRQIPSRFPTHRNVYRDDCRFVSDGTGLEPGQTKTGYPHEGGILPFALKSSSHCVNLISLMEKIILLVCAFVHLVRGANLLGAGVSVNGHISGAAFNDAALGAACNGTGCNGTVNAALY